MAEEVHLVKTAFNKWSPADPQGSEACKSFAVGTIVRVNLTKPRNAKHHRKGMALLNLVFNNQDKYSSFDDLLVEIKLQCGHYTEHVTEGGKLCYIPKSISFGKMDQVAFDAFYAKMEQVVLRDFFPGMSCAVLRQEVLDFMSNWQG